MLLVDAIEAWGQQHRTEFDRARLEYLGSIWSTVRKSDASELDVDSMTKDDARVVMALFDKDERRRVSEILNSVRTWSLSQGPAPSDAEPVVPVEPVETVVRAESARRTIVPIEAGSPTPTVTPRVAPPLSTPRVTPAPARTVGSPPPTHVLIGAALVAVVLLGVYLLFFRGGEDTNTVTTSGEAASSQPAVAAGSSGDSDDFCQLARRYSEDDPFGELSLFDGEAFFDQILGVWATLASTAPPEIAQDIALFQVEFTKVRDLAAQSGYKMDDPALLAAMEALDSTAMDAAGANIDAYMAQVCGVDLDGAVGASGASGAPAGPDELTGAEGISEADVGASDDSFLTSLGVTAELAECLTRELGDIDNAVGDTSLLMKPVCNTTLFDVISDLDG